MSLPYTSRELSERVEIDVQKRPNRFRRRTWWASLWLCVLTAVWIGYKGAEGDHHIYEGGDVATVHRMFENDCAKCHVENWTPLDRILKADFSSHVYSVENSSCLKCHAGSKHYPTQHPEDQQPNCAECHHDHQGDVDLKRLSDRHCVKCHRSGLEVFHVSTGESTKSVDFPEAITSFGDHPEFAAVKLMNGKDVAGFLKDQLPLDATTRHASRQLIEWGSKFVRGEDGSITQEEAWIDRSGIIFNHEKHMKVYQDGDDLVWEIESYRGDEVEPRRFKNINQLCAQCHQEAPDGRYILPIVYEEHCQTCHGLYYRGGGEDQLPHDDPLIVQGYLTDRLTVAILGEAASEKPSKVAQNVGREVPGRRRPLRDSQAAELKKRLRSTMQEAMMELDRVDPISDNEQKTLRAVHSVLGKEAKGGCAYCHTVKQKIPSDDPLVGGWEIVGPRYVTERKSLARSSDGEFAARYDGSDTKDDGFRMIPNRWQPHARFSHKSHQMMNCADCHKDAVRSEQTADILLPEIRLCQECHSSSPKQPGGGSPIRHFGARADCVECHTYHDHSRDDYTEPLNTILAPSKTGLDAILTNKKTKE